VEWTCALLKDPAELKKGTDGLLLASIDDATAPGKALLASARQVLANLGKSASDVITVADISDPLKLFVDTNFDGDGVIISEAADTPALRQTILDAITIQGSLPDRSGRPGIDQARADAFFVECEAHAGWSAASAQAQILGDATAAAHAAFSAVKGKISDYFSRCRLAAYDDRAANALSCAEQDYYLAFAAKEFSNAEVVGLPLQRIEPNKPLKLTELLNPAWSERVAAFHQRVVLPLLGADKKTLADDEWNDLCARFAPYEEWLASKKGAAVEKLGIQRIRDIVAANHRAAVNDLIAQDLAVRPQVSGFGDVERLVRNYRDLGTLLRNFVNFADFYALSKESIFQAGTLYLDQRSCSLCVRIDDPAAHMQLGALSMVHIAYCNLSRASEKMTVAACFTQGDGDYLMVGRNGVFYDRQGRDWDATITKIIDNPISIRQAVWSPYKKFVRFIEEQVAKRAATAHEAATANLQGAASTAVDTAGRGKPSMEKPKFEVGTVAALGVGLGAISTMIAGAFAGFFKLGWWMPLGILGIILLISGPSTLIAWLKLRQRTLGPILEGTGWAINGRVKINMPLGAYLTDAKELPPGTKRLLNDPFSDEKERRRRKCLTILVVMALVLAGVVLWRFDWLKARWGASYTPGAGAATPTEPVAPAPAATEAPMP